MKTIQKSSLPGKIDLFLSLVAQSHNHEVADECRKKFLDDPKSTENPERVLAAVMHIELEPLHKQQVEVSLRACNTL